MILNDPLPHPIGYRNKHFRQKWCKEEEYSINFTPQNHVLLSNLKIKQDNFRILVILPSLLISVLSHSCVWFQKSVFQAALFKYNNRIESKIHPDACSKKLLELGSFQLYTYIYMQDPTLKLTLCHICICEEANVIFMDNQVQ